MPLLQEVEGLSMSMLGGVGGAVDDCTSDTCGGGGGGSMDEEACDTSKGEGGGGGGGRSMTDISGPGGGLERRIIMGRLSNVASSDACSGE